MRPYFLTWSPQSATEFPEVVGGHGATFHTSDGQSWLDFGSFSYASNAGHGHKRIQDAIAKQASILCESLPNAPHPLKTALAQELLSIAPSGYSKVFFTLGGAEANENAMKIARMVTGRYKFISRYRSYHGATLGALSLSGDYRRPPLEPALPGVVHVHDCPCHYQAGLDKVCDASCADVIAETIALEGRDTVAAVFMEPITGANGVLIPPRGYYKDVAAACAESGTLFVMDEVLTGFGRTGKWFACEHYDVQPDMIVVSKGLTGGYAPLGAVLVHERIAGHFNDNVLYGGLTQYAHPLGCAAALESIFVYRDEGLVTNAEKLAGDFEQRLSESPGGQRPRSVGLLGAIELDLSPEQWGTLQTRLHQKGLYVHAYPTRGWIVLAPPLCIERSQMQDGFDRLHEVLENL